jgi:hypothetical protein
MKGRLLFPALAALAAAACGDPLRFEARVPVAEQTLVVYALTGTPLAAPSALSTIDHTVLRLPASSFDLAFDIDAEGRAVLYPVQLVGSGFGQTGLQKRPGAAFESVTRAPDGPYDEAAATTAAIGDLVLVRARPIDCTQQIRREIYSKLAVTAVDLATRAITIRLRVDPNCGFRDFGDGIPKD